MQISRTLDGDGFKLLAETDPPKGANLSAFVEGAANIRDLVTAVVVTDCAQAIMHMTPLAPCRLLVERGMRPVMSVNARDRNRLAFQGDLLAAYSSGVRELLLTTGADPSAGDQPMTGRCQDMGLDVMLQCISAMRIGRDLGGEPLDAPCDFRTGVCLGVSSDAAANRRTAEGIGRLAELGIQYVVPAPTYDMDVVSMFADAGRGAGISVHPSVLLLKSVAMIRYLNNLPDASPMPDGLLKRMMKAPDKLRCGMEIAAEFILSLKDRCGGALLVSVGWDSRLKEFLEMLASAGAP